MQRLWGVVRDANGRAVPNATVNIYDGGTNTPSVLYDPNGGQTPVSTITNPLTADALGFYLCAVVAGSYKIAENLGQGATRIWDWNYYSDTSGGGGGTWGSITGTLSNQTDLQAALDTKALKTIAFSVVGPLSGGGDLSADRTFTTSMATNKLIGRGTAGTGVMEEITLGTNLSFTGTTLNAAGGGTPGGADTQVQYNNAGAFAGNAALSFNQGTGALSATSFVGAGTGLTGTASSLTAGIALALKSATTTVDVSAAAAPTNGQVLTATAGTTATWQTLPVVNPTIVDDTTTNATMYPIWVTAFSGAQPIYASSTDLTWNPSTNVLALPGSTGGFVFRASSSSGSAFGVSGGGTSGFIAGSAAYYMWSNGAPLAVTNDLFLGRDAAASLRMGLSAANPPTPQTFSVQDASGSNTPGAVWTLRPSRATGTGISGNIIIQKSVPIGSGSSLQTAATAWTFRSTDGYLVVVDDNSGAGIVCPSGSKGLQIGTAVTEKLSFWGVTTVVQPSGAAQAAVAVTAATNVAPWGYTTAAQADGIVTLLNEVRNQLTTLGLWKGAA